MSRRRNQVSGDAARQEAFRLLDEAYFYMRDGATERYGYDTAVEAAFVAGQAYALTGDDRLLEVSQDASALILESMGLDPVDPMELPPVAEYLEERTRQQLVRSPALRRYLRGEEERPEAGMQRTERLPRALNDAPCVDALMEVIAGNFIYVDKDAEPREKVHAALSMAMHAGAATVLATTKKGRQGAERLAKKSRDLADQAIRACARQPNHPPRGRKSPPRRRKISSGTRRLKNRLLKIH